MRVSLAILKLPSMTEDDSEWNTKDDGKRPWKEEESFQIIKTVS